MSETITMLNEIVKLTILFQQKFYKMIQLLWLLDGHIIILVVFYK